MADMEEERSKHGNMEQEKKEQEIIDFLAALYSDQTGMLWSYEVRNDDSAGGTGTGV